MPGKLNGGVLGSLDLATLELGVGPRRVGNVLLRHIKDSDCGELQTGIPARSDLVVATGDGAAVGARGTGSLDVIGAVGGFCNLGVDLEGPSAGAVVLSADTLHVLDDPVGHVGGLTTGLQVGLGGRRRGRDRGSGHDGGGDGLSELHFGGCKG